MRINLSPIQKVQIVYLKPKRLSEKIKLQTENQIRASGTHLKEKGLKAQVPGERQTRAGLNHFTPDLSSRLVSQGASRQDSCRQEMFSGPKERNEASTK